MKRKCLTTIALMFILIIAQSTMRAQVSVIASDPWEQAGRRFIHQLQQHQFAKAVASFDSIMKKQFGQDKMQQAWLGLEKQLGSFLTVEQVKVERYKQYHRVHLVSRFASGTLDILVVFDANKQIAGLWFRNAPAPEYEIPAYADTSRFYEETVSFGKEGWELPGIITLPKGKGPFPVVVLVHGSGPNDRDETIGPNRPFRDLAWGLASKGIGTFRYDKRTRVYGNKIDPKNLTVEQEVIEDALEALKTVRAIEKVDSTKTFLLGHSLGALLAPEIAVRDGRLAGVILCAAPARSLEELVHDQILYLHKMSSDTSIQSQSQVDSLLALLKKLKNRQLLNSVEVLGAAASYYYDLQNRNQLEFAARLRCPVLVCQGDRDYQVTLKDFAIWKGRFSQDPLWQFRLYPDLNHLFISGKGPSSPKEYMDRQRHVAEEVIKDIVDWIASIH